MGHGRVPGSIPGPGKRVTNTAPTHELTADEGGPARSSEHLRDQRSTHPLDISFVLRHRYELMTEAEQGLRATYPGGGQLTHRDSRSLGGRSLTALLLALGILASLLLTTSPAGAAMTNAESRLANELFAQLNNERAARGLPALTIDTSMSTATNRWAERIENDGYLSHSSDGRAEIVAYGGKTGQITDAWMRSPGHRHLITDANLVPASVAVTCDRDGRMWAVVQFRRLDTSKATQSSSASTPRVTPSTVGGSCSNPPAAVSAAMVNSIKRLYRAYYLRSEDAGGLQYWRNQAAAGMTIWRISDHFAAADEFVQRYGSLGHRDFIDLVYRNVMGRSADAGGQRYWLDRLRSGTSRGELMTYFSDSPEYRQRTGLN